MDSKKEWLVTVQLDIDHPENICEVLVEGSENLTLTEVYLLAADYLRKLVCTDPTVKGYSIQSAICQDQRTRLNFRGVISS